MDLEIITLNEMPERGRQTPYDISYMRNLNYNTNLFMKQEQTHKQKTVYQKGKQVG